MINDQGGRKKLKDYMIDEKIPQKQRDQLWLLADGSHILWIIGWRISEAVKINGNTEMCIRDRYSMCRSTLWLWKPQGAGAGAGNDNLPDAGSTADLSVMEFLKNIFS